MGGEMGAVTGSAGALMIVCVCVCVCVGLGQAFFPATTRDGNPIGNPFAVGGTGANVGPGVYSTPSGFTRKPPSHAPFSASSTRDDAVADSTCGWAWWACGCCDGARFTPRGQSGGGAVLQCLLAWDPALRCFAKWLALLEDFTSWDLRFLLFWCVCV